MVLDLVLLLLRLALDLSPGRRPELREGLGFEITVNRIFKLSQQEPQAWLVVPSNAAEKLSVSPDAWGFAHYEQGYTFGAIRAPVVKSSGQLRIGNEEYIARFEPAESLNPLAVDQGCLRWVVLSAEDKLGISFGFLPELFQRGALHTL